MKTLLIALFAIVLASCGAVKYSTQIDHRSVSQQCTFRPLTDYQRSLLQNEALITPLPESAPYFVGDSVYQMYVIRDSIYTIHQTWSQAWKQSDRLQFFSGLAIYGSTTGTFAYLTSIATLVDPSAVLIPLTGILVGGPLIGGPMEWYKENGSREIKKREYWYWYVLQPQTREAFWSRPAKAY